MVHIKITKGLDIPITGKPEGPIQPIKLAGEASTAGTPSQIALDLTSFENIKFRLLVKIDDVVKIGQPLAEDRACGRMFVSPAGGVIKDIIRGPKRVLESIIIQPSATEEYVHFSHIHPENASLTQLVQRFMEAGIFAKIRCRPFNLLAKPGKLPRSIFVKAVESAPFVPPAEMQVEGYEKEFQVGLSALDVLCEGPVHLVYRQGSPCRAFTEAQNVVKHTVEGPHPVANVSVHIQHIDRLLSPNDLIWTITAHDVVCIGVLLSKGRIHIERVISIAGPGILPGKTGYFKTREGVPISHLISGRIPKGLMRLVSGDPLMGKKVQATDFLGFNHYVFCVIPENTSRELLHFFRLGSDKYSFSRAYLSGHLDNEDREYYFTTNQHGEHRAFIDSTLYDKVMPLDVSTMLLTKAVMAEDFELAEQLGLNEVDSEDFALPTFVCPSKMEMVDIIKKGLKQYAEDMLQ